MIISRFRTIQFYLKLYQIYPTEKDAKRAINEAVDLMSELDIVDRLELMMEFPDELLQDLFVAMAPLVRPNLSSLSTLKESYTKWIVPNLPEEKWAWIYAEVNNGIQEQAAI